MIPLQASRGYGQCRQQLVLGWLRPTFGDFWKMFPSLLPSLTLLFILLFRCVIMVAEKVEERVCIPVDIGGVKFHYTQYKRSPRKARLDRSSMVSRILRHGGNTLRFLRLYLGPSKFEYIVTSRLLLFRLTEESGDHSKALAAVHSPSPGVIIPLLAD